MTPPFAVRTTPLYERRSNKLFKVHRDFEGVEQSAKVVLSADPYNRTRRYHIKKLEGVPAGEGQYRLSLGRWRFRYDIVAQIVELHYCGLRREDTYR
jgi:hypothetical protein